MAVISVAPFVLQNCKFTIAADQYESHVSSVEFVPSASIQSWRGLTPTSGYTDTGYATWTCNLSYAQDWATTNSLSNYLHNNEGKEVVCTFEPITGGTGAKIVTATLIITPGSIGGSVDAIATGTVTLGVSGRPVITTAV